ncbi:MAG: protein kinase, partial [Terracidiphilus sp.]
LEGSEKSCSFLTVLQGMQEALIQLNLAGGVEADAFIGQWTFAMSLSHPHLAKVFAAGRCVIDGRDLVYVVTERPYATLSKMIEDRRLKADPAREFFNPVLDALSYLHKNSVVHGFVNPSNIQLADLKPKLAMTDLLVAGSAKRSIPGTGKYDAPELQHGVVTAAADVWSVGMTMWEAMTGTPLSWDSSRNEDPTVTEALPCPFRQIVQDCLRVDPLRRCTIESVLERLDTSKSIPLADSVSPIPVKMDIPVPAATPAPASEIPIKDAPTKLRSRIEEIDAEETTEPVLFSKSLTHFEETPLHRFRVIPYAIVLLAVIAIVSFLLVRKYQKMNTPPATANQSAPAISPPVPQQQPAAPTPAPAPAPPVASQTEPDTSQPASETQPTDSSPAETQSAPTVSEPAPQPSEPSVPHHARVVENADGEVARRVLPAVSPGALSGMRRPVEVLIRVSVNEEGRVADASYVSPGPGNYFARLAQRTALSWEFTPPMRNGDPRRSVWMLRFYFEREKTEVTATEEKQ